MPVGQPMAPASLGQELHALCARLDALEYELRRPLTSTQADSSRVIPNPE